MIKITAICCYEKVDQYEEIDCNKDGNNSSKSCNKRVLAIINLKIKLKKTVREKCVPINYDQIALIVIIVIFIKLRYYFW